MIQLRDGLGLALEAGFALRAFGEMLGEDLDRNDTVEAGVFGFVDLAHPPGPDGSEDFIRAEARSGSQGHS